VGERRRGRRRDYRPPSVRRGVVAVVAGFPLVFAAWSGTSFATTSKQRTRVIEVKAAALPGLGKILVDDGGRTLYAYTPDDRGASKCYDVCASVWPPLLLPRGVTRPRGGSGVRAALLGTTRRKNGSLQITYNRWPLYLYARDHTPGEARGQGDDMGLWYVVGVGGAIDRRVPSGQTGA
jgi:predicted lipoprotein with Yx(FWY)xxD motif